MAADVDDLAFGVGHPRRAIDHFCDLAVVVVAGAHEARDPERPQPLLGELHPRSHPRESLLGEAPLDRGRIGGERPRLLWREDDRVQPAGAELLFRGLERLGAVETLGARTLADPPPAVVRDDEHELLAGDVATEDDRVGFVRLRGIHELAKAGLRAVNVGGEEQPRTWTLASFQHQEISMREMPRGGGGGGSGGGRRGGGGLPRPNGNALGIAVDHERVRVGPRCAVRRHSSRRVTGDGVEVRRRNAVRGRGRGRSERGCERLGEEALVVRARRLASASTSASTGGRSRHPGSRRQRPSSSWQTGCSRRSSGQVGYGSSTIACTNGCTGRRVRERRSRLLRAFRATRAAADSGLRRDQSPAVARRTRPGPRWPRARRSESPGR